LDAVNIESLTSQLLYSIQTAGREYVKGKHLVSSLARHAKGNA